MNPALFAAVESYEFSARLNVVSGKTQFIRGLSEAPEVRALLAAARSSQDGTLDVFYRLLDAISAPYDAAYENPADVAIASYLLVLCFADNDLAALATDLALDCGGCWWARKLALATKAVRKKRSANVRVSAEGSQRQSAPARITHSADSAFTYFGAHGCRPAVESGLGRHPAFGPTLRGGRFQRNRGAGNVGGPTQGAPRRNRGSANKRQTLEAVT